MFHYKPLDVEWIAGVLIAITIIMLLIEMERIKNTSINSRKD